MHDPNSVLAEEREAAVMFEVGTCRKQAGYDWCFHLGVIWPLLFSIAVVIPSEVADGGIANGTFIGTLKCHLPTIPRCCYGTRSLFSHGVHEQGDEFHRRGGCTPSAHTPVKNRAARPAGGRLQPLSRDLCV